MDPVVASAAPGAEQDPADSAMQSRPKMMPISRRFNRMSPFRMWLNSWPMTPCQLVAREHFHADARDTGCAASPVVWPAAKAFDARLVRNT